MSISKDLRMYLGDPIVHDRVNESHSKHIIEKFSKKIASWKISCLSFAGKRTLIQSVISSIPNYTMQTMKLPAKVCQKINKLNEDFLWGDMISKNKIHFVNWDQVCKPKKFGGIGLRNSKNNNLAFNAKLGWRIMNEDSVGN